MVLLAMLGCGPGADVIPETTAQTGVFRVELGVHGELEAEESITVKCPDFRTRPEIAWMIDEGSRVSEGDPVIEFDREAMERGLLTAEAELELAQTKIQQNAAKLQLRLQELRANIEKAELDLQLAKMKRTESTSVPLVEREDAKANEQRAEMAIAAARGALKTAELDARAETQLLELEVEKRQRELNEYRDQLEKSVLTAPDDGLVLIGTNWQGKWKVGSRPWTGAELIELPNLSTMQVKAHVHEVDSPRIAKGQRATVVMEAHPDLPVQGSVSKVADLAVPMGEDDIKFLEVTVALDQTLPEMKPGMTVRVDLVLEEHPDAVWVPIEAVRAEEDGARFVYTSGLTGWSRTPVEAGVMNDTHQVVTGLEAGTTVALVAPDEEERPAAVP